MRAPRNATCSLGQWRGGQLGQRRGTGEPTRVQNRSAWWRAGGGAQAGPFNAMWLHRQGEATTPREGRSRTRQVRRRRNSRSQEIQQREWEWDTCFANQPAFRLLGAVTDSSVNAAAVVGLRALSCAAAKITRTRRAPTPHFNMRLDVDC